MNKTMMTCRNLALLLVFAAISTAGSCNAITLRDAQDSFNEGMESLSSLPRSQTFVPEVSPGEVLKLPEAHFERTLHLLDEAELDSDEDIPARLRFAAHLLRAYSYYSLYRLSERGDDDATVYRHAAQNIVSQSGVAVQQYQKIYAAIPDPKKPLVKREASLFLLIHPLVRAEDHMRTFELLQTQKENMDTSGLTPAERDERKKEAQKERLRLFSLYKHLLTDTVALKGADGTDLMNHIPRTSPAAEYYVTIVCDLIRASFAALEAIGLRATDSRKLTEAQTIGDFAGAIAQWYTGKSPTPTLEAIGAVNSRLELVFRDVYLMTNGLYGGVQMDVPSPKKAP